MSCKYDKEGTFIVEGRVEMFSYVGHDQIEACLRDRETGKILMFKHSKVTAAPASIADILDNILNWSKFGAFKSDRKDFRHKLQLLERRLKDNGISIILQRDGSYEQEEFSPKLSSK